MALLADSVEWYDPGHVWGGRFGPLALDNELRMRWMQAKADGVLAISSYLEGYYRGCGRKVLRVPVLVDLEEPTWKARRGTLTWKGNALRLGFVGGAGKKDHLQNAIRGLGLAGDAAKEVTLVIVGPSRDELARSLGADAHLLEALGSRLQFAGRLPHSEALHALAMTDFSILLRPNLRFAQAGFPTKLVESLAIGVPVICNLTGDIGMYVRDGQEGIVVRDSSPEAFAEGLKRALSLTDAQRLAMCERAKHQAGRSFDFRNWVEPLRNFMRNVCGQAGEDPGQ
jgi:glycosyltransferase involved in cell wall biosynthesis